MPAFQDITPLGSDEHYAYVISDNNQIYQSSWFAFMSEMDNEYATKLLFEAEASELFNKTLIVKMGSELYINSTMC